MSEDTRFLTIIFILLVLVGLLPIIIFSIYWISGATNSYYGMMSHMMGMMGIVMFPTYLIWLLFFTIIIIGIFGLLYIAPRKSVEKRAAVKRVEEPSIENLFRVLREDEKLVVKLLIDNGGRMLQKDIRWETGFTRLQVHRIINRLVERGIVRKRSVGNTNEIILEDWVMKYIGKE